MIDKTLIENALSLTGKTMEDIEEISSADWHSDSEYFYKLSIEKFCYYLLSEQFIEMYPGDPNEYMEDIPHAIMRYQSGDSTLLITLLKKIGK